MSYICCCYHIALQMEQKGKIIDEKKNLAEQRLIVPLLNYEETHKRRMEELALAEKKLEEGVIMDTRKQTNKDQQDEKTRQNKINLIAALVKHHGIVSTACDACALSRRVYYDYYNSDPDFRELAEEAKEVAKDFVESQLFENIEKGDTISIIFYLKTRCKDRGYVERVDVNKNINLKYSNWTDEDIKREIEKYAGRVALAEGSPQKAM